MIMYKYPGAITEIMGLAYSGEAVTAASCPTIEGASSHVRRRNDTYQIRLSTLLGRASKLSGLADEENPRTTAPKQTRVRSADTAMAALSIHKRETSDRYDN